MYLLYEHLTVLINVPRFSCHRDLFLFHFEAFGSDSNFDIFDRFSPVVFPHCVVSSGLQF